MQYMYIIYIKFDIIMLNIILYYIILSYNYILMFVL